MGYVTEIGIDILVDPFGQMVACRHKGLDSVVWETFFLVLLPLAIFCLEKPILDG